MGDCIGLNIAHRLLKRHGISGRHTTRGTNPKVKPFMAYEPGFILVDIKFLPLMADEDERRYLFMANDQAKRWDFIAVHASNMTAANARCFLVALVKIAPFRFQATLTDNGMEFTDRIKTSVQLKSTGEHFYGAP